MKALSEKEKELCKQIIEKYEKETLKECVEVFVCDGEPSFMDNHIGGTPYFPDGAPYPRTKSGEPMALLLQVNLEDFELDGFPQKGILEVFIDAKVGWPLEYKLFIFQKGYRQADYVPNINLEDFIATKPLKIDFRKTSSHMPVSDYRAEDVLQRIAAEVTGDKNFINDIRYGNIFELMEHNHPKACLGGYADFTQDDPRYAEDNRDFCLFKLDSLLHESIYIGDCGILTVTISKENLIAGNVDEAVVDWDCC